MTPVFDDAKYLRLIKRLNLSAFAAIVLFAAFTIFAFFGKTEIALIIAILALFPETVYFIILVKFRAERRLFEKQIQADAKAVSDSAKNLIESTNEEEKIAFIKHEEI